jgi:hypothetical protein
MTRRTRLLLGFGLQAAVAVAGGSARGDEASPETARAEFVRGTELVEKAQWAEALAAFERAGHIRAHAVTTFNIGACERAMGRYARAKQTFERALAENEASGRAQLPESLALEIRGYIAEIERLMVKVALTVSLPDASIAVDGRPLELRQAGPQTLAIAGVRRPGPAERAPARAFTVLVDPGLHVFAFSRKGYTDAVVQRTLSPGATVPIHVELERIPATLRIAANREGAQVSIDDRPVGSAPVNVSRAAGRYHVVVRKAGFESYAAVVAVNPGDQVELRASLAPERPSIVRRWWFWTAAAAVVTATAVGTYIAVKPDPTRPPVSGGSLGWKIDVPK